jgi:hypothetical protein
MRGGCAVIVGIIGLVVIAAIVVGFGIWIWHEVRQPWS